MIFPHNIFSRPHYCFDPVSIDPPTPQPHSLKNCDAHGFRHDDGERAHVVGTYLSHSREVEIRISSRIEVDMSVNMGGLSHM